MTHRDRRVVEQAKGVLMLRYGTGSYEALGLMARWSAEAGVSVGDTARALVGGICQGRIPVGDDHVAALVRLIEQRLRENEPGRHLEPAPQVGPPTERVADPQTPAETGQQAAVQTAVEQTQKEIVMDQTPPRLPEQRQPVDDRELEGMADQVEPRPHERHPHRHHSLRGLAGGFSERRWRYSDALEAARRLSSGGGRPAASSG